MSWRVAGGRAHRERRQPAARAQFGLLEKHGDYAARARDYADKGRALRLLRRRAADRNPDEFYHHMLRAAVKDGEHHEIEKEEEYTPEQIKLMQTQDIKYVNMKRTQDSRRISRLQSSLHMIDVADQTPNTHTFFVDSTADSSQFDLAARLDTHPALIARKSNRLRLSELSKMSLPEVDPENVKQLKRQRDKSYRELATRIQREKQLTVVQQKMELKRHLQDARIMKPKRVQRGTKTSAPIYEFQYQRKK